MNIRLAWAVIFFLLIALGCGNESSPPAQQQTATPATPEVTTPENMQVRDDGTVIHLPTRMEFPEKLQNYKRVQVTPVDATASNLAVGYSSNDGSVTATIYVYPVPDYLKNTGINVLDQHFQEVTGATLQMIRGSEMTISEPAKLEQSSRTLTGMRAEFDLPPGVNESPTESVSLTYLFLDQGYFYKYRITYPVDLDNLAAGETAESFLQELKLPASKAN